MVVQALTEEQRSEHGVSSGVVVAQVSSGAAARAGLRKGDIILSVDNKPVQGVKQFNSMIDGLDPGKTVAMLVQRGGSPTFLALKVPEEN
jgi:serine protease Do